MTHMISFLNVLLGLGKLRGLILATAKQCKPDTGRYISIIICKIHPHVMTATSKTPAKKSNCNEHSYISRNSGQNGKGDEHDVAYVINW
jgi:hypothetical protein